MLDVECRMLDVGCRMLDVGYGMSDVGFGVSDLGIIGIKNPCDVVAGILLCFVSLLKPRVGDLMGLTEKANKLEFSVLGYGN